MDTIKREDAIKALDDGMNKWYSNVTLRQSMRDAINGIPSAEKQGEWIPIIEANEFGDVYQSGIYCSECGETLRCEANYCPNCGARMKGADDDAD